MTRKIGRYEFQKFINTPVNVFFDAKELLRHAKRAEYCERLVNEGTRDATGGEEFHKEKLGRAGEGPRSSAILYIKTFRMIYLSRRCHPHVILSFRFRDVSRRMAHSSSAKYS